MRGISSGLDWDVWQEESPSTVAVSESRRTERIIVFMVLLGVLFGFLRVMRKRDWQPSIYRLGSGWVLVEFGGRGGEMTAFSQTTCTDFPVREAIPPVIVIMVTESPSSSVRTPRSKPRQKAGSSGRISIKPDPQSKPRRSTWNVCLAPRESTIFTSIVCDSINTTLHQPDRTMLRIPSE